MGAQVVDYRVSAIVVLCKDCGNDVGLYPARHKCTPVDRPPMPPLPLKFTNTLSPITPEVSSPSTSKWASLRGKAPEPTEIEHNEESIYFNNFAQNLPGTNETSPATGKKLWGKVRQNDKWKQMNEKNKASDDKPKQTGKLWEKLIQVTHTVTSQDDRGAESDEDDWDGETHVSRILREYYEKERLPLPAWLFDDRSRKTNKVESKSQEDVSAPSRTPSRRRLWDNTAERELSSREKERQELRQQPPPPLPEAHVDNRVDAYIETRKDTHQENRRQPSNRVPYRSHEPRENYSEFRSEDYYNERNGHDDRYNHRDEERNDRDPRRGRVPPQQYHNNSHYQQTQSPTRPPRHYEEEARSYNRAGNRYPSDDSYHLQAQLSASSQKYYEGEQKGYTVADNRYPPKDVYHSSPTTVSDTYNASPQGRTRDTGRGKYRGGNERYDNYF